MHQKIGKRICRWMAHHIYLSDCWESDQSHTYSPQWLRCVYQSKHRPHTLYPHHTMTTVFKKKCLSMFTFQAMSSDSSWTSALLTAGFHRRTTTDVITLRKQLPEVTSVNTDKCRVFDFLPLLGTMNKRCYTVCTLHSECYVPVPQVLVCWAAWLVC